MIYLIGGMPRVGKSTLAQMILERKNISWIPLDAVREALGAVSPNLGIYEGENWWVGHQEKFFPFLKEFIDSLIISRTSCVLEGDSFTPEQAGALVETFGAKACFLGTSQLDIETLKRFKGAGDPWLETISEEKLNSLPDWIMTKSAEYKLGCDKYGIKYFDVSAGHQETLESAYFHLTTN